MNERKSELKKQNEEEKNPKAGDIAERMKREISELFGKIEEFVKSPSLSKSERNEATALANETKNLKEGIEIISENVKSAGADVLKGPEIDWHDLEEIKSFDSELKPIKRLHVSFQSFNRVYLCEHPQYGSVVIKMPSSKEEINFLEGTKDTQGVTPIIKSYEYGTIFYFIRINERFI